MLARFAPWQGYGESSWVEVNVPDITSNGGADIACSQYDGLGGHNCVMVYVDTRGNRKPVLRYRRFSNDLFQWSFGPARSMRAYGFTRPSVTVAPDDVRSQFFVAFDQAKGTVFTSTISRDSDSVSGSTPYYPRSAAEWLRPAGLGTWKNGPHTRVDLMVAQ